MTDVDPASAPAPPTDGSGGDHRRWIGRALIVAGVVILLSVCWVGWRSYQAYRHLDAAADQVTSIQEQIKGLDDIDLEKVRASVSAMRTEADGAASATSDPLYRLAGHLPWIGPNLRAISDIADTVQALATTTAPVLVDVADTVQPAALVPKNGVIDVAPIAAASQKLSAADEQVVAATEAMSTIDARQLAHPVASAVTSLQTKLRKLGETTGTAARIGRLAPPLLGAAGPTTYLVVFQNLAEPRATGGIFGSYAVLQVDNGKLQITDQGASSRDLGTFDPPVATPPNLPEALYGTLPQTYATDVNLTPDFPTAASLFVQMYAIRKHVHVDGVLALDPVALSYLLAGSDAIPIGNGLQLTSANVTDILLSRAYRLYPEAGDVPARDRFLGEATAKAFAAITSAHGTASAEVSGLAKAASQHRLLLWSADAAQEKDILQTDISGSLPTSDGSTPVIGIFRNDGTGAKLGYYAGGSATVEAGDCHAGERAVTVTVPLTYSAPARGLPTYVLGFKRAGPYVLRTNILIFAPVSGSISAVTLDGKVPPVVWATQADRRVAMITVDLHPGQRATVIGRLSVPASRSVADVFSPSVVMTPGVTPWKSTAPPWRAC